jgi:TIR domain
MADIFLSYTEHDRNTVSRLAQTLQAVGWTVWWDRRIPAGQTWRSVLERELQSMHCMVVLWSTRSVKSDWVCEEAAEARQLDRLVPVLIERVRPPAGFREVQAADLVDWDGARDFVGLQQLIDDIEQMIGKPGMAQASQPRMSSDAAATGNSPVASSRFQRGPLALDATAQPAHPKPSRKLLPWAAAAGALLIAGGAYWVSSARRERPVIQEAPPAKIEAPSQIEPPSITAAPVVPPVETKPKPVTAVSKGSDRIDTSQRPGPKPVVRSPSSVNPRCAALTERLALGEPLSNESQSFYQHECRK